MKTKTNRKIFRLLMGGIFIAGMAACSGGEEKAADAGDKLIPAHEAMAKKETKAEDPSKSIGVGPIKEVKLGELDQQMVDAGKVIFEGKCSACHKVDTRYVGPPLKGVTEKRTPEWIMNMILNPEVMVKEDAQARALLAEYMAPMANQNLTEEEARKVLEYFRTLK